MLTMLFITLTITKEDPNSSLFASGFFRDGVRTLQAFGQCKASKEISLQALPAWCGRGAAWFMRGL